MVSSASRRDILAVCVVHDVNVGGESPLSREVNPKDQSRPSASL